MTRSAPSPQRQKDRYLSRRQSLLEGIKKKYPHVRKGAVLLVAAFEKEAQEFKQESSFYYLTGIQEPAVFMLMDLEGQTVVYLPAYASDRSLWVNAPLQVEHTNPESLGVDKLELLGKSIQGYAFPLLFAPDAVSNLVDQLKTRLGADGTLFTLNNRKTYAEQSIVLGEIVENVPALSGQVQDISPLVAALRRTKSHYEIEQLYKALELTLIAQGGAAASLDEGVQECQIQAGIEYIFRDANTRAAYPSIVATGSNATILHYKPTSRPMRNGELVLIDVGAEINHYCADLTRTYPVSGTFTKRQREVYQVVLDVQEHIAQLAAPGYWLRNAEHPEKSLHHQAVAMFEKKGYARYFPHGIGHFLGLDVHDVGDTSLPLQEGDVITIEPGIYIREEGLGIRIEDNYWIVKDGSICLSQDLPKDIDSVEEMCSPEQDDILD